MNALVKLLTTFAGRIPRRQWWTGFIITVVGSIAGTLLFNPDMLVSDEAVPPQWPDTLWQLACLVPATAITVKHFGLLIDPEAGGVGAAAFWLLLVVILAVTIDNGFLRGTRGPNRYGPDPLAGA
jgi:uncharacterized membrane protein YhaH (DUF805 family)